jgi:hypothetical protein
MSSGGYWQTIALFPAMKPQVHTSPHAQDAHETNDASNQNHQLITFNSE